MGMFDDLVPSSGGAFDDLVPTKGPAKLGADAFPDFLRQELANADWGTRNIAGAGTALSNIWQKAKQVADVADPARVTPLAPVLNAIQQLGGHSDPQQIEANKIIEDAAPVGSMAGNVALAAVPFGLAGNGLKAAAVVGGAFGAAQPVSGDQSPQNIALQTTKDAVLSAILSMGGQWGANKTGQIVSNKISDLQTLMQKNAPITKTTNDAIDAGLALPPNSVNPSWWNAFRESIGGKAATAQSASNRNAPLVDDLMRQELHLPENAPLTEGTLQTARNAAYTVGYKPVAATAKVAADEGLLNDLIGLSPASSGGAVPNPAQSQISGLIDNLANKGQWTGEQLVGDIRSLRKQASDNFRAASVPNSGNPGAQDLAHAQSAAADALENLAQRNITAQGGDPQALQLLREARQYIAKTHDLEDALVGGGGTVDSSVLAHKADKNPGRMTGNLEVVGNAANNYPKAFQPYNKVNGPGASVLNAVGGSILGGIAGGVEDHPKLGAVAGPLALMALRGGARSQMLSKRSQNLLRDLYKLGVAPRAVAGALQYAPVAGAVLGREALSQ